VPPQDCPQIDPCTIKVEIDEFNTTESSMDVDVKQELPDEFFSGE